MCFLDHIKVVLKKQYSFLVRVTSNELIVVCLAVAFLDINNFSLVGLMVIWFALVR